MESPNHDLLLTADAQCALSVPQSDVFLESIHLFCAAGVPGASFPLYEAA